jgi:hypothetical protein
MTEQAPPRSLDIAITPADARSVRPSVRTTVANLAHFAGRGARESLETAPFVGPLVPRRPIGEDEHHLAAAAAWLRRSVDVTGGSGSAHSWAFAKGWRPAYPETTGYILKTFLRLAGWQDAAVHEAIARRLADWLLTVQLPSGGIPGLTLGRGVGPVVFNTGMVLLGWNAAYARWADPAYLDAGSRAGTFLVSCMDETGSFVRHTSDELVHAYNVRAAWALMELGMLADRPEFVSAAERNVRWTLAQENERAFFRHNAFRRGGSALTHGIGYVLSGLIECYLLTGRDDYLAPVRRSADRLVALYGRRGRLVAELDESWRELSGHICLVGYCQLAIVLMQLFSVEDDPRYLNLALQLIDDVKRSQQLGDGDGNHVGAIPGSYPIHGRYARLQYPNWATKFYIDALLMKRGTLSDYAHHVLDELPARGRSTLEARADRPPGEAP